LRNKKVIDSSLTHNTAYLSQPVLLEKSRDHLGKFHNEKEPFESFELPHTSIFADKNGNWFIFKPESQIFKTFEARQFDSDAYVESKGGQRMLQVIFDEHTSEEIEKEYGPIMKVRSYEEVFERLKGIAKSLVKDGEIQNLYEQEGHKVHQSDCAGENGWEVLLKLGCDESRVNEMREDTAKLAKL